MMKKISYIMFFVLIVLLLQGCINNEQVTAELIEYHNNNWKTLQEVKRDKIKPIASEYITLALEENDPGIERLVREEFLPIQSEIVKDLKEVQVESKEIKKLNQLQIESEEFGYESFKELADVLRDGREKEIDSMYEQFNQYQKELEKKYEKVEDERERLMDKYNVELIADYDEEGNRVMEMVRKKEE